MVNFILEVLDSGPLFDLEAKVSDNLLTVKDNLNVLIYMEDISGLGEVEILVEYYVKDFNDNEISLGNEFLNVSGVLEVEKSFDIPDDLELGDYIFYVKLIYDERIAISSSPFEIVEVSPWYKVIVATVIIIFISLVIVGVIYFNNKKGKLV